MFGMDMKEFLRLLSVAIIPGLFAITLHEVSHGWVAKKLGDPTAYMLGRLTVNPLKHVDLLGTIIVPIGMLLFAPAGMLFGWAKPVPVAVENLRNRKRDMAIVAIAGPISNLLMAVFWAVVAHVLINYTTASGPAANWVLGMGIFGMGFNVLLAVINLIPIPPLDGGRVLVGLLPRKASDLVERVEPFGLIILILLMVSGLLAPFVECANSLLAVYHSVVGLA